MRAPDELPIESEAGVRGVLGLLPLATAVSALLILNGWLVFVGVRHPIRIENRFIQAKWQLAGDPGRAFDWIILGDSSGALGVDPEVLSQHLPGEAVNLCTFGGMGITGDLWMLDHYLATHPSPRGIILVHAADVWTGRHGEPFYQYSAAIPESTADLILRLLRLSPRPIHWMTFFEYRDFFPVLLVKDRLRKWIGWPTEATDRDSPLMALPRSGRRRLTPSQVRPDYVKAQCSKYWPAEEVSAGWSINWRARCALREIATRASNVEVPLLVVNGPIAECVRQRPEYANRFARLDADLDRLLVGHSIHRVFPDWRTFSPKDMENCNHIAGSAVDVYSRELANAILESINGESP